MSAYVTETPVPFAPLPDHAVAIKFDHDRDLTFDATPMRRAWEDAYKWAALMVTYDEIERAKESARLGMDLEEAYIKRVCGR